MKIVNRITPHVLDDAGNLVAVFTGEDAQANAERFLSPPMLTPEQVCEAIRKLDEVGHFQYMTISEAVHDLYLSMSKPLKVVPRCALCDDELCNGTFIYDGRKCDGIPF